MFLPVEKPNKGFIHRDQIVKALQRTDKEPYRVQTADGSTYFVYPHVMEAFVERCAAEFVPAQPGTFVIAYVAEDDSVFKSTVIGWRSDEFNGLVPMTVDGHDHEKGGFYVLHPNGMVDGSAGQFWDDIESWLQSMRAIQE